MLIIRFAVDRRRFADHIIYIRYYLPVDYLCVNSEAVRWITEVSADQYSLITDERSEAELMSEENWPFPIN